MPHSLSIYQETSREAHKQHKREHKGKLDQAILDALRDAGADGLTCLELERIVRYPHQSVSGNLRHLVVDGIVENSGTTRLVEGASRRAIVWRIPVVRTVQQTMFGEL